MGQVRSGHSRIRLTLALAIAAGLPAFARPAIGAVTPVWVDPVSVSDTAVPVEAPAIGASDTGTLLAVWRAFDGTNWRIQASVRLYAGTWSAPRYLSPAGYDADTPVATAVGDNYADEREQAAWRLFNGSNWVVQTSAWSQGTWSEPVTVSAPGQDAADPHVEIWLVSTGAEHPPYYRAHPLVVWRRFDGSNWRVQGAEGSITGESFGPPLTFSAAGQDAEYLGLNDQAIFWSGFDGQDWRAQRIWVAGDFSRSQPSTVSPAGEDALDPQVAGGAAVWMSDTGGHRQLRAAISTDFGATWQPPVTLSGTGADVAAPSMASAVGGFAGTAVWTELADGEWRVRAATVGDSGWQPAVFLSEPGQDAQQPTIGARHALAAWVRFDGTHWRVEAAELVDGAWTAYRGLSEADADATNPVVAPKPPSKALLWVRTGAGNPTIRARGVDTLPPDTTVAGLRYTQYAPTVTVSWSAKDDWSPVASYDMRYRVKEWDGGTWTTVRVLTGSPETSINRRLRTGRTYCFTARARDILGRLGEWRGPTCVVTPTDDRELIRHNVWQLKHAAGYYAGTYLQATRQGSMLTLPLHKAKSAYLLVSRGPLQGKIHVQFGEFFRDFNLWAPSFKRQAVRLVFDNWWRGISLKLRITVTSAGRQVRVDGVFVGRDTF